MTPTSKIVSSVELPIERTFAECQRKFLKHQEKISKQHKRAIWNQNVIVFENFQEKLTQALASVDLKLWYAVCLSDRYIGKCRVKSNSAGLKSSLDPAINSKRACENVYYIA